MQGVKIQWREELGWGVTKSLDRVRMAGQELFGRDMWRVWEVEETISVRLGLLELVWVRAAPVQFERTGT